MKQNGSDEKHELEHQFLKRQLNKNVDWNAGYTSVREVVGMGVFFT